MNEIYCYYHKTLEPIDRFDINFNNRTIARKCREGKAMQYNYPYRDKKAKGTAKKAGRPPKNKVV